jgi:raffinose/stachyose/melibiose transport system permease protein
VATRLEPRARLVPRAAERPRQRPRLVRYVPSWILGIAVSLAIVVPLLYAVFGGFKTNGDLVGSPALLPNEWVFTNYVELLGAPTFWGQLWNSLLVGAITVIATVGCSALAAFAFARMNFRGREVTYTLFTLGLLFPIAVAILPLFILLRTIGLVGNPLGVALPQAAFGLPLTIVILRPFFRAIPNELEDAARVDGCGTFGFFVRILLPLARPALATVSVLAVVSSWNAFLLPLLVFQGADQWTLPLGVMNFTTEHTSDWARILAFTTLSMIPAIVFYAFAERQIVSGLTAGSVKS